MRAFNESDYELVKNYEKDFTRAIESRYCTGLLKDELEVVQKIYNETLNRQANLSCGGCVLQMMTSVGRLYFGYKRKLEEELQKQKKEKRQRKPRVKKDEDKTIIEADKGMSDAL